MPWISTPLYLLVVGNGRCCIPTLIVLKASGSSWYVWLVSIATAIPHRTNPTRKLSNIYIIWSTRHLKFSRREGDLYTFWPSSQTTGVWGLGFGVWGLGFG